MSEAANTKILHMLTWALSPESLTLTILACHIKAESRLANKGYVWHF